MPVDKYGNWYPIGGQPPARPEFKPAPAQPKPPPTPAPALAGFRRLDEASVKPAPPLAAPLKPWKPTTVADFRMLEAGDRPPGVPLLPGGTISEWKPTLGQRLRGADNLLKAGVNDSLTAMAAGKVADKLFTPAAPVLGPKLPLAGVKPPVEPKGAGLIPYAAGRFIGDLPLLAASYATGGAAGTVGGTAIVPRLAPVLGKLPPLGQKITQGAIKLGSRGIGAGSVYGAGQAAIEGQSAPEAAKTIAQNAALFGIGDPLLSGAGVVVGKGIAKGLQSGKGYVQGLKEPLKLPQLGKLNLTKQLPQLPAPKQGGLLPEFASDPAGVVRARGGTSQLALKEPAPDAALRSYSDQMGYQWPLTTQQRGEVEFLKAVDELRQPVEDLLTVPMPKNKRTVALVEYVYKAFNGEIPKAEIRKLPYNELVDMAQTVSKQRKGNLWNTFGEEAAKRGKDLDDLQRTASDPEYARWKEVVGLAEPPPQPLKPKLPTIPTAELNAARNILPNLQNPARARKVLQTFPELRQELPKLGKLPGKPPIMPKTAKQAKPKPAPRIPLTPLRPAARGDMVGMQAMSGPAPGTSAGGQQVLDTVKRRDIVKHLEKTLNVPVRVGRFKQNALGIFKIRPEVIRTRLANDLPVISHEVGHSLDKQLGLANPAFDGELMALGRQTSRPGYTPERVRKEGVAEFMRLYLTDEQAARRSVPGYYAAFEKQMQAYPEIHDALLTARKDIHTWYNQPAKARILGSISVGDKQGARKMSLDSLYTLTFDELHPLKRFVEEVGVKGLPIEKDPYKLAWLARGWSGKAETLLHKGVLNAGGKKVGKSLDEVLKPVEKELDDFRAYIVAEHSLEVTAQGKHTGITDKDANEVISNSPAHYQQVLDDLVQYQDAVMKQLVDAGVISEQALTKMRSTYSNYVPFYRVFDESPGEIAEWLSQGAFANLRNPVKKMTGSTRDIVDPLESIVKNTYLFTNVAERNRVGRAIVELADQKPGLGRLVEKVEGGRSGRENVLTVYRNGQPEHYQLEPELYRATLALDKESANLAVKLMSYPASWLRAGAVLSPDFMVRNPVRDAFTAFINSKYGFVPVIDTMRGLFHAVKKDDLYWQWMNSGGAHSTLVSLDRDYLQKNLRQVLPGNVRQQLMNNLNPVEWLRSLSELSEQATRLGEFGKGVRKGADPLEAALAARDVTLDFSRLGTHTKGINRIIAFFNASVQGTDKLRRQFMTDPKGATSKTALSVTLPSVLLYFVNRNDPRYQELPQWQKDLFWIIPTKEHLIRIPKPFELGVLFGTVPERALAWMDSKDPKSFDELGKTLLDAGAPGYIPTALLPGLEVWANKSFFTNTPIVPQRESNLEPRLQYGPYTTEAAKGIGGALNASPRKVETLIRGYTGGLGMYAAKSLDAPLTTVRRNLYGDVPPPKPALALEDRPVIKAFTAKPYASAQSVEDFYTELNRMEQQYNSANQGGMLLPAGFSMDRLKQLRQVSRDFSEIRKAVREVQSSKTMTPERKKAEIERLDMLMVNMARQVQGKKAVTK